MKHSQVNEKPSDLNGRLFSTFPISEITYLPVRPNGTWAQDLLNQAMPL